MAAALCVLIMRSRYVRAAAIGVLACWLLWFKNACEPNDTNNKEE